MGNYQVLIQFISNVIISQRMYLKAKLML